MVLKRGDIACFVANWHDKATNIRAIAEELNIGLDSLVFVDDNPFERDIVRRELPMVAVPELPDDPALYRTASPMPGISRAGGHRGGPRAQPAVPGNSRARALKASATDLAAYLRGPGDASCAGAASTAIGLQRIVQLINKTNQFNLTTRRYTEEEVLALMDDTARSACSFA